MYADSEPVMFEDDVFRAEVPLLKSENSDEGAIRSDKGAINGDEGAIRSDKGAINGDEGEIKNLDDREAAIYRFIAENGSASSAQICQLLNLKAPSVRKIFRKMVDKSVIQPIGVSRSRKYVLKK